MPAPPPVLYVENVLEDAILTLEPDGAVAGKDVDRLTDRDIGLECEDSGTTGVRIWHADRGLDAPTPTVHAWLFAGTGYAGELLTLETSPDDTVWTERATVTPTTDTPQRVVVPTPFAVPRYVRVFATDPTVPIKFTEWWVAPELVFAFKPAARFLREPTLPNVSTVESFAGRAFGVKRGDRRWSAQYTMTYAPRTDQAVAYALLEAIQDGASPFWVWTIQEDLRWVRLVGGIDFAAADGMAEGQLDIPVALAEELP